jgi:hypothetical protein
MPVGAIVLQHLGTAERFVDSVRDGAAVCERLPIGTYRPVVQVGTAVHDNDHEYTLSNLEVRTNTNLKVNLPDNKIRIRVLDRQRRPFAGERIRVVGSGVDTASGLEYKIRVEGVTDASGRFRLGALPLAVFTVSTDLRREVARLRVVPGPQEEEIIVP